MVTRVRIEATGESAAEVERHLHAVANLIAREVERSAVAHTGEQFIERDQGEPEGWTAHKGRLLMYLNVANDSEQVRWLTSQTGGCSRAPELSHEELPQIAVQPLQV